MVFLSQSQLQLQLLAIAVAITIAVNWCCFTDRTGFGGCGVVGSGSLDPWVVVSGSLVLFHRQDRIWGLLGLNLWILGRCLRIVGFFGRWLRIRIEAAVIAGIKV